MSALDVTLRDVVSTLQAEGLLGDEGVTYLDNRPEAQPWYIRTMVGFGAWLASLLLIGFVASLSLLMDGGYALIGLVLIVGAILLRRRSENDFLVQCALAISLAGQGLAAYGFAQTVGFEEFEAFLGFVLVVSSALFFLLPDRIHRVLMVLLATGSLTTLFYVYEMNALVPLLGPAFAAALVFLQIRLPALVATQFGIFVRPLMDGLMLSAFGVLLLSTVYVLPELGLKYEFYPRPWISTLLLGGLFLYVGTLIWPTVVSPDNGKATLYLYGMMVVVVMCAWAAPGLLLGLIVLTLGAVFGRNTFIGAGTGFFALFLATYVYGIEVTMLTKSAVLLATGIVILIARWLLMRLTATGPGGTKHA